MPELFYQYNTEKDLLYLMLNLNYIYCTSTGVSKRNSEKKKYYDINLFWNSLQIKA